MTVIIAVVRRFLKKNWIVAVVLSFTILGGFFRFYQLRERLYFQLDEERDWHMMRRAVTYHRPPLIGSYLPPGLYLGPLWFYLSIAIGTVIHLDPFVFGVIASALGTITIPLVYWVGKDLFGDARIGLVASALYATSYLTSIYSRIWWPLTFSPIATLVVYQSLKRIKEGRVRWAWPLFVALTIAFHGEPPNATTILLIVLSFVIFKLPWKNPHVVGGSSFFILSHIPVALFDVKHDFVITKGLVHLVQSFAKTGSAVSLTSITTPAIHALARFLVPSGRPDTIAQIGWCPEYLAERINGIPPWFFLLSTFLVIGFFIHTVRKFSKKSPGVQLIAMHIVILLGGLALFDVLSPTPIHEWFFYHLFPTSALLWAFVIVSATRSSPVFCVIAISGIVIINAWTIISSENSHGLGYRAKAVDFTLSVLPTDASFSVASIGRCFAWSGYRTLFVSRGRIPTKSYLDELFGGWLYPKELSDRQPLWRVTFVDHERYPLDAETVLRYRAATERATQRARFGAIEVLLQKIE